MIISCTAIYKHLRTQAFIMNQMKKHKSNLVSKSHFNNVFYLKHKYYIEGITLIDIEDCVSVIQAINNWIIVKVLLLVAQLLICMYSASVQDLTCVTAIVHVHWHHDT